MITPYCFMLLLLILMNNELLPSFAFQQPSLRTTANHSFQRRNRINPPSCRRQPTFIYQKSKKYYDDDDEEEDEDYDDDKKYEYARVGSRRRRRSRYEEDDDDYDDRESEDGRRRPSSSSSKYYDDDDDDDEYYDDNEFDDIIDELDEKISNQLFEANIIPNAELDSIDPDGAAERFPQVLKDPKFWLDTILVFALYNFIVSWGNENVALFF